MKQGFRIYFRSVYMHFNRWFTCGSKLHFDANTTRNINNKKEFHFAGPLATDYIFMINKTWVAKTTTWCSWNICYLLLTAMEGNVFRKVSPKCGGGGGVLPPVWCHVPLGRGVWCGGVLPPGGVFLLVGLPSEGLSPGGRLLVMTSSGGNCSGQYTS